MTREEAKEIIYYSFFEKGKYGLTKNNIFKLINKIYNDFESRTCKNCSQYKDGKCRIFQGAKCKYTLDVIDDKNFGCNRFERKEQ